MKKVINGKLYDTEKAKRMGYDGSGDGFSHWHEELYQKRTGEFFLYGEGGPMTKYARSIGQNQWSGGEKIIPLSVEAACNWAEDHLDADEYEQIFGIPDEGEEVAALNMQIDAQLMAKLRAKAAEDGISLKACMEEILKKAL